jgi:iron complex transport system ATP-binding protein
MIALHNAGVQFGQRWIFRNLDLEIARGASLALLGPNGRGKTTLIRALIGTQPLTEGTRQAPAIVGYVPQAGSPVAYPVLDMVVMGRAQALGVFGSPSAEDYHTARAALSTVGLAAVVSRSFDEISGGERQLVLLARALATGAQTIVLDEPASALDLANQHRLLVILNDLRRNGNYTIIFSTHLPQHALHATDETVLMMSEHKTLRGLTVDMLSEENLEQTYHVPVRRFVMADGQIAIVPMLGAEAEKGANSYRRSKAHE